MCLCGKFFLPRFLQIILLISNQPIFSYQQPNNHRCSHNRRNSVYWQCKIKSWHLGNHIAKEHDNRSYKYGTPKQNAVVTRLKK